VSFQHEISTIVKRFSMVGALEVLEYALLTESLPPPLPYDRKINGLEGIKSTTPLSLSLPYSNPGFLIVFSFFITKYYCNCCSKIYILND